MKKRESKARLDKAGKYRVREGKAVIGRERQSKARQNKAMQCRATQGKAGYGRDM